MTDTTMSIFSRLTDNKAIVKFVKEIEKHPCLYDQKSIEYSNRDLKSKAWMEIAKKINSSVGDCKAKWTKIRIAYSRTLRQSHDKNNVKKPYYLAKYLKFIKPGNRFRTERCQVPQTTENADQVYETDEIDINKVDEESNNSDNLSSSNVGPHQHKLYLDEIYFDNDDKMDDTIDSKDATKSVISTVQSAIDYRNTNNYNDSRPEKISQCCENLECNPRKMFLLSLLPDVQKLTEQQMRSFRRQVITLIDNVIYE